MVGIEVVLESHIAQVVPLLEETCSHHPTHIECQEEKLKVYLMAFTDVVSESIQDLGYQVSTIGPLESRSKCPTLG